MKTYLIPIDFSKASVNAAEFAAIKLMWIILFCLTPIMFPYTKLLCQALI